ncbi:LysR family transcriptional regulator [Bordetella petrii]|uniref:LysR family transcriptional regulator n=1 Tax=Bordetella petrii TaxID=94624 RepID=A0ABT7W1D3_9BORD|nr:LysR family transcriptional regulator [Bordetella petrii]MDM9558985.1 LysR family transcriptional regulator [Bordetella petrii]
MLDDLALFVAIVDDGSLQAAARRLQLPPATLTRRLQKLEARLGCQLLLRSARSLKPTPEGRQYYEQCRPLLTALQQATATLDDDLNQIKGTLRVLAPVSLARGLLAPAWTSFLAAWPDIRLELILDNRNEDLWRHGADLAVRVGPQHDPKLRQRRLGGFGLDVVAAPAYLAAHGEPRHPRELEQHALLVSEPLATWYFMAPDGGERIELQPAGRCRVNELELMVAMAEAGLGIMYCPRTLTGAAVASGRLRRLLTDWRTPQRVLYAVWPQQQLPRKVRALLEHLSDFAASTPVLQGAEAAPGPQPQ